MKKITICRSHYLTFQRLIVFFKYDEKIYVQNYKCKLDPIEYSNRAIEKTQNFFIEERINEDLRIFFVENLIPYANNFGQGLQYSIEETLTRFSEQLDLQLIIEYRNTVKSIIETRINLKKKLNSFYAVISKKYSNEKKLINTKAELLTDYFLKYRFFELPKVICLKAGSQIKLIDLISTSEIPYVIAMLNYLDFNLYLEKNCFPTKKQMFKEMAKWFNTHLRTISGNYNSLNQGTTENPKRYSAHKYIKQVENDYENLNKG